MKNRYIFRSRVSAAQFRRVVRLFSLDLNTVQIAALSGLSRVTINRYLRALRERMATWCDAGSPLSGEIEVDESYLGARRIKGKRGRGAFGKTAVFGLIKRNGQVYTEIVPDCRKATLQAIIRGRVALDSVIYSDGWRGYDGLVDVGYGKHFKVAHRHDEFVRGRVHINGIEGFWGFAKSRLGKFRGMSKQTFYLHLKECEFRFNYRRDRIYRILLKLCLENPLKLSCPFKKFKKLMRAELQSRGVISDWAGVERGDVWVGDDWAQVVMFVGQPKKNSFFVVRQLAVCLS